MKLFLSSSTFCILLSLLEVHCEESAAAAAANEHKADSSLTDSSADEHQLSRVKRGSLYDMQRLARGIQMLRLGKRGVPMLRLGRSSPSDDEEPSEELWSDLQDDQGYYFPYYPGDAYLPVETDGPTRFRRSADPSQESVPSDSVFGQTSNNDVKRSVDGLQEPQEGAESELLDEEEGGDGIDKRPMNMLRLGKRPMNMLRLGKRPMNMLRLGKRPMNMLRLGKRPMNMLRLGKRDGEEDEEVFDDEEVYEPLEEGEEDLTADKRPMNMLRLGKRPMNMLRLGKRPMNMLRLGKRPMNMLRLGKRPMNMLRLGKRPMNMLRLGKRPMDMLRLGKRPMNMLRLGKRSDE